MTNEGFTGIASNASYDQWSPARQYSLYHRGARLLTETASARLATPIDIPFDQLGTGRGYDARVASWNFPSLWPGGHWTYGDIVRYQTAASWALFLDAARNRRAWLEGYAAQADRALGALPAWGTRQVAVGDRDPEDAARHAGARAHDLDAAARPGRDPRSRPRR